MWRLRTDAQIPGKFTMSDVPDEKFSAVFPNSPTCDTALKQVQRRGMSAASKQALSEKMKAKWAAKKANKPVSV